MLALVGFLIIIVMMLLIFRSKALPAFCFAVLPIIGALICGFSLADISDFIGKGVGSTWQTAILFIFSVTYFGIMNDAGLFDKLVDGLVKKAGKNITLILIFTSIIAMIGHIDGAAATTYLITIPTMLPIYKKMHIRPTVLLLLCGAATGIMNLVPWGGPTIRAATTANVDATELWIKMIPMQIFGLVSLIGIAIYLGVVETKRLAKLGLVAAETEEADEEKSVDLSLKRPKLLWFNLIFTIVLIIALVQKWLPTYAVFMVGTIIVLAVNYPDPQLQQKRIQAHAPSSIMLTVTLLCAGIFLGVMTQTGMVLEMSKVLISALPVGLQRYLHYIVGALGAPLGMVLGPDPYYYGIMPIIGQIVEPFGVTLDTVGRAMLIGENVGLSVSPVVPPTFLAIGLAGVDLKEHIKFSFLPLWALSVVMMLFAIIVGII
ncbi:MULTISPECIES: CitMHS family transporter [Enterocloster]|uniref:Citrate-Mg2+:H+ or citrate-Ca2+:H+ symporter, CitMHS family n=1 Tax=Enterocloster lavalensis TaxID=460384 RepID=A0A1I0FPT6_9FIRM|nr:MULTISPECIES: citrate:proton symporter [Enterocloster]PST33044.1 citrate:proton symporter [Enterocloster lavalensis]SET59340.1 citrate-Mg2+:H+ or citrate-Ca2+:H+ symporter, CitMHS family [Enterocloster lavalensis]